MNEPTTNASVRQAFCRRRWADVGLMLLVCLLWALCYPLITVAVTSASPLKLGAWRSLLAGMILFVPFFLFRSERMPPVRLWISLAAVGFFLASIGFAGMFLAGGRITPGLATVLANTQPLIAAVMGLIVLKEKVSAPTWFAMALGLLGVGVAGYDTLFGSGGQSTPAGVGFVLIGAVGVASGNVILKRLSKKVDALPAMAIAMTFGSFPLFIAGFAFESDQTVTWSGSFLLTLVTLAVAGTAVPLVLWLRLLNRRKLSEVNALTFTTPLFGLWIGALFFGERLGLLEWLGVGLIVLSVLIVGTGITKRSSTHDERD